ncbi:MAG: hypothetical protein WCA46_23175 [Actinocatenispora sp.]
MFLRNRNIRRTVAAVGVTGAAGIALLLGSVAPAAASAGELRTPPTAAAPQHDGTALASIQAWCSDGTNIRTGPGTNYTSVGLCYHSNYVTASCLAYRSGYTYPWAKIVDHTTGKSGYAYGQYMTAVGWETLPTC